MTLIAAEKAPWETEGAEKREAVRRMFGDVAPTYDRLNAVISLSLHHRWRRLAVTKLQLRPGCVALDLCCGTGDFMRPLRQAVGETGMVVGIDFTPAMLEIAAGKHLGSLTLGDACRLPIASESVDAVTVGWGIRNVADIDAAHREVWRVLKPGGRFASVDMAKPRNRALRSVASGFLRGILPLLGSVIGKREAYTYLPQSTERFWSREELRGSMELAGFVRVDWKDFLFGNVCLHWGEKP